MRVLRQDLAPVPVNHYILYLIAIIALVILSPWQSGDYQLTLYTLTGLCLTAIILAYVGYVLIKLLGKIHPHLKLAAHYGLANISRRTKQSLIQIVGIGLGVTVMLLLTLVRTDLLSNWQHRLPDNTPNYFLINIQPEQVDAVNNYLADHIKGDAKTLSDDKRSSDQN